MTATTTAGPAVADRRQLAEVLLRRSGLELNPGVDHDQVLALLAKVLDRYDPPYTSHGTLVVKSLLPLPGPRPAEELAVRQVVAGGRAPTPKAVHGELQQMAEATRAREARLARLRPLVDSEGPKAAAAVVDLWRQRRKAPSPLLLGQRLGWAKADTWPMTHLLLEAGYLANENRKLTPGPRA